MKEVKTLNKANNRVYYFDMLRIFATFAVVLIHSSGAGWSDMSPSTFIWQICNFFDGISRWCVPIFVMISGALFLNKEPNIKKLFSKNILRIITAFIFWSVLYGVSTIFIYGKSVKLAVGEMIVGHYHLWFLFMIVGLYLAVPILKKITKDSKITNYFLIASFIFAFVIPQGVSFVSVFSESVAASLNKILDAVNFNIALGYTGYFVLGYVLSKAELTKKQTKIIYCAGLLGFVSTIGLSVAFSVFKGKSVDVFYDYLSVTVLLESIGVFMFFKNMKLNISEKTGVVLNKLSKYSFGVYLVHVLILEIVTDYLKFDLFRINPIVSIPVFALLLTVVSFAVSAVINHIPILKKYIV